MANTIDFILTNSAKELIPKVLNGKTLNFTRMAIGDGYAYDTTVAKGFKTLVHEVLNLNITKKEVIDSATVKITSAFTNTDTNAEFYYREVGLFAEDPDTEQEVLYAYGNRNDAAELITPAGNNVVSKQLIFVINVGDSANVTFNVKQGIYALQSDMLDVQTDINKAKTNIEMVQNDIETLQTGKADKNLVNTGMITNCLLEVPQLKLELADGVLTLKAGSKCYFAGGTEISITTDTSITNNYNGNLIVFVDSNKRIGLAFNGGTIISDPEMTPNNHIYFNATSKKCLFVTNGAFKEVSLPLAKITVSNGAISSIDQVFNGFGYIGSTIFALPGVKCLMPNGRNLDGTLNNVVKTLTTVQHYNITEEFVDEETPIVLTSTHIGYFRSYKTFYYGDRPTNPAHHTRWYDSVNNVWWEYSNENKWQIGSFCVIGTLDINNTVINAFNYYKTFKAVNFHDYAKKITELEARLSALESI